MLLPVVIFVFFIVQLCIIQSSTVEGSSSSASYGKETIIGIVGRDFVMIASDPSIQTNDGSISFIKSSKVDKIHLLYNPYPYQNRVLQYYDDPNNRKNIILIDDDDDSKNKLDYDDVHNQRNQRRIQCTMAIAAIGDIVDSDRLISWIQSSVAIQEYQSTNVGTDIDYIDCCSSAIKDIADNDDDSDNSLYRGAAGVGVISGEEESILSIDAISNLVRYQISNSLRTRSKLNVCLLVAGMMLYDKDNGMSLDINENNNNNNNLYVSSPIQDQLSKLKSSSSSSIETSFILESDNHISKEIPDVIDTTTIHENPNNSIDNTKDGIQKMMNPDFVATTKVRRDYNRCQQQQQQQLKPCLYWLDEYGSIQNVKYGAHGLGSMFILSILDQEYKSAITRTEAIALLRKCFQQLQTRYIINTVSNNKQPLIKCIDQYGCHTII